jgi:hypothetical protein
VAMKLGHPAGLTSGPLEPHFCPKHRLNPPTPLGGKCEERASLASKVLPSLVLVQCSSRVERGEVLRARGLPGLSGVLGVARAQKLYQNPFRFDRVF